MHSMPLLPAETVTEALIATGGNTRLAAERLQISTQVLIASLASDPSAQESLNAQLRTLTLLQAFDTLHSAKVLMDSMLTELDADDFVKFYSSLIQTIQTLTTPPVRPARDAGDLADAILRMLPPEQRRNLMALVGATGEASLPSRAGTTEPDEGGPERNPLDDLGVVVNGKSG